MAKVGISVEARIYQKTIRSQGTHWKWTFKYKGQEYIGYTMTKWGAKRAVKRKLHNIVFPPGPPKLPKTRYTIEI